MIAITVSSSTCHCQDGVTQIGNRRTKGFGRCEELGLGAGGGAISQAETHVCRRRAAMAWWVQADSTDQGSNQADVGLCASVMSCSLSKVLVAP